MVGAGTGIIPLQGRGIIPEWGGGFPRNQHDDEYAKLPPW
jgi:hypothetical protein